MISNKIFSFIGLAMRAGKIDIGESRVRDRIKSEKARLVIMSDDAAFNTKKKITDMCVFRDIKLIILSDRYTLGKCLGREFAVVISVSDGEFSNQIVKLFNESNEGLCDIRR